jgi:hypothetical protein
MPQLMDCALGDAGILDKFDDAQIVTVVNRKVQNQRFPIALVHDHDSWPRFGG